MKLLPILIGCFILTACTTTDTFQSATAPQKTDIFNPTLPPMGVRGEHDKNYELYNGACDGNTITYEKKWDLGT